jgi:hypothetical protein
MLPTSHQAAFLRLLPVFQLHAQILFRFALALPSKRTEAILHDLAETTRLVPSRSFFDVVGLLRIAKFRTKTGYNTLTKV